jgi:signal transduction histidine kinase
MLFLVRDILDFAQIESESLILNLQFTSVSTLINECLEVLSFKASEKGILLTSENALPEILSNVNTDANRVKQIIINLLSNAIKYTSRGFVKIQV